MDVGFVGIDSDPLDAYVWGSSPPMSMRELLVTGGDVEKLHLYRWWRACLENNLGPGEHVSASSRP